MKLHSYYYLPPPSQPQSEKKTKKNAKKNRKTKQKNSQKYVNSNPRSSQNQKQDRLSERKNEYPSVLPCRNYFVSQARFFSLKIRHPFCKPFRTLSQRQDFSHSHSLK